MSRRHHLTTLVLLAAGAAGCGDRADPGPTDPRSHPQVPVLPAAGTATDAMGGLAGPASRAAQERLARRLALALAEPGFRAYVKDALDRSPVREHKLQFQHFLGRSGGRARAALARARRRSGVVRRCRRALDHRARAVPARARLIARRGPAARASW